MKSKSLRTSPSSKDWITNKEVCLRFGFSPRMMERLRNTYQIHFSKLGKTIIYDRKDIDKLIISNQVV